MVTPDIETISSGPKSVSTDSTVVKAQVLGSSTRPNYVTNTIQTIPK